jgi:hypothetical protein
MAFKVFISYSTKDFPMVEHVRRLLQSSEVEIFITEYSVNPGTQLAVIIENAIRNSDLFILLWSRNSEASEWVPMEIGIARGNNKTIIPVVLEDGLELPGFIKDLKYLPAYRNPEESLIWLQNHIFLKAEKQQRTQALVKLCLAGVLIWLLSQSKS